MARTISALLAGFLLMASTGAWAADDPLDGTWKLTVLSANQNVTFWLVKLESKDGKATGEIVAARQGIPKSTVGDVSVKDGHLRLALKVDADKYTFEGKLPPEGGKKIYGSFTLDRLVPAQLELTTLKSLDAFDVAKETVASQSSGPELFDAAVTLLRQAGAKKAKAEEVRTWASKANKAAEAHGARWQMDVDLRIAEALEGQEEFAPIALQYARQAERLLAASDKPATQKRVLAILASTLKKAGKEDEAKEVEARIGKISLVSTTKFPGRKGKSDRTVLVELFTGAECPPCVAADIGFDALAQTYKPKDVILLQYHLHIPGPDPLTNSDNEARAKFYGDEIEGTPTILLNGKADEKVQGGGGEGQGQDKYDVYVKAIDPLLEEEAKVKLQATATRKGDKIEVTANVSDLEKPGDNVRLRFALVEETVKYQGRNKLDTHHHVVRSMPGGEKGFALKEKASKQTVTVDLGELRKKLTTYLDEYGKENKFPNKERPLDLKKLRIVAFVQNDATKAVLQATEVEIKADE